MFRAAAAVATCLALLAFGRSSSLALSTGLPDGRAYELVSRYTENGLEKGLDGELPNFALAATSGDAVDWEGVGGCCGAGSGAVNLYRSRRTPEGWQTGALTPAPPQPLSGFFAGQEPVFFTGDLSQTIFTTPAPYSEGVRRPAGSHANDLYLQGPDGRLTWLSQGGTGTGEGPYSAELDAATPDASTVVFSSAEPLTGDASGLKELNYPPQYLYLRDHLGDVYAEATTLVDVKEGQLISPYGGILGAGGWLKEELLPPDYQGTSTHALSENGEKAFFESPPPRTELEGAGRPHLFMRDLELEPPTVEQPRTVEIDDASSGGEARYEGAAADGSLVFFTSNEELAGASSANELYEFNTTSRAIGPDQPMSVLAIGGDEGVTGVTAIADDGSAVYFVATAKLPAPGPLGAEAQAGQPNLYRYETATGTTSFLATLSWPDVNQCEPDCGHGHPAGLVAEPDVDRPAYTTSQPSLPGHQPGGSVLAFTAYANLTGVQGQAAGAAAVLAAEAHTGEHTLAVSSTAGFAAGQHIAIGSGADEEIDVIQSVQPPSEPGEPGHIEVAEYGPDGFDGIVDVHPAGEPVTRLHAEVYRYDALADPQESLLCLSCAPEGVAPVGDAALGPAGGGSYAPPGKPVPLSEDGSRVFFESPTPLLPEAQAPPAGASDPPENVYEWGEGRLHLVSDGSGAGFRLDGTTPSGDDVFITTHAALTDPNAAGEHPAGGEAAIYDARVAGGFPAQQPSETPAPCTEATCRTRPTGGAPSFSNPESALLGATGPEERAVPLPTLTIARPTPHQRRAFVRTGHLALAVHASAPTGLTVSASAPIAGGNLEVAHASATLPRAGTALLAITLDGAARRLLVHRGTLALRISASSTVGGLPATLALTLRRPSRPAAHTSVHRGGASG